MTAQRIPHGHSRGPFEKADVNHVMRLNFDVRMGRDPVPERNRYAGGNFADQDIRVQTVAEMIAKMDSWIEPHSGFCGGFPVPGGGYLSLYARGRRIGRPITALQMAEQLITKRSQPPTVLDNLLNPENPYEVGVFYGRIGVVVGLFTLLAVAVWGLVNLVQALV